MGLIARRASKRQCEKCADCGPEVECFDCRTLRALDDRPNDVVALRRQLAGAVGVLTAMTQFVEEQVHDPERAGALVRRARAVIADPRGQ